ncbi:uncharacterized protein MYCFIDRAFT_52511 [Pseudocercospora fijiensis CIRAD86]|uniref:Cyclin-like domain-containing protein n=1 Tax=Pseudocercospora fijiensis (strain CIRAD86) TaxID=383855 RepID=M3ANF4_PSEFD|nr:uncharacterized protein MYCFIDRAFT_52511 [Pseudocercospora fijiensis CIRAD86]EME86131.1 hypothetical protein MYCFIDRAFT_52511 [Pseudocercospora fijiensis CIRAD86]
MSTAGALTSSPSLSPRSSFHHSSPRAFVPAHRSPAANRVSPRASYSRPFNAPATSSAPQQPHKSFLESEPVAGSGAGYVDAGTQYSPDGFPPTAKVAAAAVDRPVGSRTAASGSSSNPPSTATVTVTRKRKEAAPPPDSSPEPMSGASASSGAPHSAQPNEPGVRDERSRVVGSASTPSNTDPELQEARSTHGHSAAPKRSKAVPGSSKIMPLKYETCSPKDLGVLISNMLMELIRINDRIPLRDGRLTRFHSRAPPGISVSDYLQRLIQHATLSPPILLSMVYYIDRLCTLYPAFTINSLTVHRFLITAATVAAKGLSDSFWTNPTYARIGGIPVSELATLELELLQRVQWKIVPKPEVLEEYYSSLVDRADGYEIEAGSASSDTSSLAESEEAASSSSPKLAKREDENMDVT